MSAADVVFRQATAADLSAVTILLSDCGLPAQDLTPEILSGFELAFAADGRLVGQVGLETFGDIGLMRSLAVAPELRRQGLGEKLVSQCENDVRRAGLSAVYLLTTTLADYFLGRAYEEIPRETVPAAIAAHAQFRSLCPASARCLKKPL